MGGERGRRWCGVRVVGEGGGCEGKGVRGVRGWGGEVVVHLRGLGVVDRL